MDSDIKNFYPTPENIIAEMLKGIKPCECSILEPSAGKGDIIKFLIKSGFSGNIDFIEPVEEFCDIVKNIKIKEEYVEHNRDRRKIYPRYAGSDFLSFSTFKTYNLIIMNPPFSDGDKHLLKAIDLMSSGGRIVCLLNSETLNNPYSNSRKQLLNYLKQYNAEIVDLGPAFSDSERKTDVNVSLIRINIPHKEEDVYIFEGLKKETEKQEYNISFKDNELVISEPIQNLIEHYNMEIAAGKRLYTEYYAIYPYLNTEIDEETSESLFLSIGSINKYIENTRYKYWKQLLKQPTFTDKMTSSMLKNFERNLIETKYIEFNISNIYQVAINSIKNAEKSIKNELIELFDKITYQSSYNKEDNSKIHLYNGWKTNKAYKVDKKFILRVFYKDSYFMNDLKHKADEIAMLIYGIEKAFAWLDYDIRACQSFTSLLNTIKENINKSNLKNIETDYFYITLYKKGTVHFTIKDEIILKRFNLLASQQKNWLPPSYGKTKYENLSEEEKETIDSFQGEDEYKKVCDNLDYYLFQNKQLALV